jgi:hypothetical protein
LLVRALKPTQLFGLKEDTGSVPRSPSGFTSGGHGLRSSDGRLLVSRPLAHLAKFSAHKGGPSPQGWVGEGGANPVDAHRPGNVLDLLLVEILERKGQPITYVIADHIGDEHAAGIGQSLDPRCDVDAVAIKVVALETITSPRLMPMRSSMRFWVATPAFRPGIAC